MAALKRAHRMYRQARNRCELLLCEPRSLAKCLELRAKRPRGARLHGSVILLPPYGRRTGPVWELSVVSCPPGPQTSWMTVEAKPAEFDEVVLPHLDAAYRLARWQLGNEHDAEDVVQEASLRALRYFRTFSGGNGRAWFLRIVRNTCWGWRGQGAQPLTDPFDEEQHSDAQSSSDPETLLLRTDDVQSLDRAMRSLPDRFRELLVLRELEGFSYRELADELGIPIGTVMSSLSRARQAFRAALETSCRE